MSDNEAEIKPKARKPVTEKQLSALAKGQATLKAKREALAKERDEHAEKVGKGEIPADVPAPKYIPKPKKETYMAPRPVERVPRKVPTEWKHKNRIATDEVKADLAALRAELASLKAPPVVKEVVVEKPIDRIVEKNKVVSGSELLNSIFFK